MGKVFCFPVSANLLSSLRRLMGLNFVPGEFGKKEPDWRV
jgi:hypothetical protein